MTKDGHIQTSSVAVLAFAFGAAVIVPSMISLALSLWAVAVALL